ncbi:unnamed protein product [Didymodactylos carnosus]|uniref:Uncharacterized protein n=1 Tax=Didymodactylos carnosus TaxID=1234261 RepID=A0A8S2NTS1_9BILA|nr:unnamed protein product [Didymodactylos carnosus]CAF4011824.1 unnamed protein product [Didymodactylos carnosus]
MDVKFVVILLFVELAALGFSIKHIMEKEMNVYNTFDTKSIVIDISNVKYQCFEKINHCLYNSSHLRFINIIHLILIFVTILSYIGLLIILILKKVDLIFELYDTTKISPYKWSKLFILMSVGINCFLLGLHYHFENINIELCSKSSRTTRIEYLSTYIIINVMEVSYLLFDFMKHDQESQQNIHNDQYQLNSSSETTRLLQT